MADQLSFASLDYAAKKKRTKREVFLAEMGHSISFAADLRPHEGKWAQTVVTQAPLGQESRRNRHHSHSPRTD